MGAPASRQEAPTYPIEVIMQSHTQPTGLDELFSVLIKTQPERHVVGQFFDQMFPPVRRVADPGLDEALCDHLAGYLATPAIAARSDDDRTLILATCLREGVAPAARETETCAMP